MFFEKRLKAHFHWPLLWVVLSLAVLGLLNLYSALGVWGEGGQVDLIWHQLAWVSVGFILLLLLVNMDYRLWEKLGIYFYVGCIVALILVLLIGKVVSGHRSWLTVGPFYVQPNFRQR